ETRPADLIVLKRQRRKKRAELDRPAPCIRRYGTIAHESLEQVDRRTVIGIGARRRGDGELGQEDRARLTHHVAGLDPAVVLAEAQLAEASVQERIGLGGHDHAQIAIAFELEVDGSGRRREQDGEEGETLHAASLIAWTGTGRRISIVVP